MSEIKNVTSILANSLYIREVKEQDGTVKTSAQQRLLKSTDMSNRSTWQKYNAAIADYAETLQSYIAATANDEPTDISNKALVAGVQAIYNVLALEGVRKDGKAYKSNNYHAQYILRHATAHDKRIIDGQAHKGEKLVSLTALRTCIEYCLNRAINDLPMPVAAITDKQATQIASAKERGEKVAKAEREAAETAAKMEAAKNAATQIEKAAKIAEKAAKSKKTA